MLSPRQKQPEAASSTSYVNQTSITSKPSAMGQLSTQIQINGQGLLMNKNKKEAQVTNNSSFNKVFYKYYHS